MWAPTVVDIMDEINRGSHLGFGIHIDALAPSIFRVLMSQACMNDHLADMHAEALKSINVDGIFGEGIVTDQRRDDITHGVRCSLMVSGLTTVDDNFDRTVQPSDDVISQWDSWESISHESGWTPRTMCISPTDSNSAYTVARVEGPEVCATTTGPKVTREGIVNTIVATMGDDMVTMRLVSTRLFYVFTCSTHPWNYSRRRVFAGILDMYAKHIGDLVTRAKNDTRWTFSSMGPKTLPYGGNIHVTMYRAPPAAPREIIWGSSLSCTIQMDTDPNISFSPVNISIVTSW